MKKLLLIILSVFLLLMVTSVLAAGSGSLSGTFDNKKYTLTISEHGFGEDQTTYSVTVDGYNVLLAGKSGKIADNMPFRVAIAWGREDYLVSSSFGVTMDPVTIAYFENKDKSPIEEPKYIILATPKGQISKGYYYVIADGLFYKADEIFGPEVTPTPKPTRTPVPSPTPVPTLVPGVNPKENPEALRTVGECVTFGTYPQTEDGTDRTPIKWRVLEYDEKNHRALLLSWYALENKQYHTAIQDITWEECSLRAWLNDEFLHTAFSEKEQSAILLTELNNGRSQGNPKCKVRGGNDTRDRVFLLSYYDAFEKYFNSNDARLCAGTDYAWTSGVHVSRDDITDGRPSSRWWLRSPGTTLNSLTGVLFSGQAYEFLPNSDSCLVRPAIWVDVNAL